MEKRSNRGDIDTGILMADGSKKMVKLPRVLVGICAGSTVDSFFAMNYQNALIGHGDLFFAEQLWTIGHITDDGRNVVAKKAIENDFDFVFYMDSDMIFPKGALAIILRNLLKGKDGEIPLVSGGLYNTRGDHRTNAYEWENGAFKSVYKELGTGIYKTDAVATGCLLIDVSVFKRMEFPYFEYKYTKGPNSDKDRWSEDIVFGKKCMDIGIHHYVDTDVVCKHLHNVCIVQTGAEMYQIERMDGQVYESEMVSKARYL